MTITETPPTDDKKLVIPGATLVARKADDVARLLDRAAANPTTASFVQKARKAEATGSLGLYLEAVAHTKAGAPFTHMKFFIVGEHVYSYGRSVGDTRANWKHRTTGDLVHSLRVVQNAISKDNVRIFGHPVLVELTSDDLSAIESDAMPPGRFRGQYRIERDFGRYDFEMPVVSAEIPDKLLRALRSSKWVQPNTAE